MTKTSVITDVIVCRRGEERVDGWKEMESYVNESQFEREGGRRGRVRNGSGVVVNMVQVGVGNM